MKYDFDTPVSRRGTHSLKWDVEENELPMWVADMDFPTAPPVREAVMKRAAHGIFGYSTVPEEWAKAYADWWETRHGFRLREEWLIFCTGVVPALSSAVRRLTRPAEKVVIQTPVYNIFFNSIINNGRQVLESPLRYDGERYFADFEDLKEKLADPQTSMMILCNPHNPTGNIWDADTLKRIGELCARHGVTVVSDEIHCDVTEPGRGYVPFASVSEECRRVSVTCVSPSKAFNIAGLQTAAVAVPDPILRHRVSRGLNNDEIAEPNAFAVQAAVAAFTEGGDWLDSLREYVSKNKRAAAEFIKTRVPGMKAVPSESTYLLWLDCGKLTQDSGLLAGYIREKTGLYLSAGGQFGGDGNRFLRMNAACPSDVLEDGLERLERAVNSFARRGG